MPIIIEANYSKKLGLPGYSSHQYMLTLRTELTDLTQVSAESQRLHALLQASVDRELQQPGWLPSGNIPVNGHPNGPAPQNGNGNGHARNGHSQPAHGSDDAWNCTPKQQDLIMRIVADNHLDKADVEVLAQERFGKAVKQLNKLEASGFIEELFERYPRPQRHGNGNGHQPSRPNYAVR